MTIVNHESPTLIFTSNTTKTQPKVIQSTFGVDINVPYGKVFSCFMASCLLGTTAFGSLQSASIKDELIMSRMLLLATTAIVIAILSIGKNSLAAITAAFFIFEVCLI